MGVSGQLHFSAVVLPGKAPNYSLNMRLCGPQSRCGHFREEENLLLVPAFEPWSVKPVAR
jgi:hypothetical protein